MMGVRVEIDPSYRWVRERGLYLLPKVVKSVTGELLVCWLKWRLAVRGGRA